MNILRNGRIEFIVALLMGAPVRLRSGKVLHIPYPKRKSAKFLDPSLFGFDFSKWQGLINFAKVFAYGAKFIILRCSYAVTRDERFLSYIGECLQYFRDVTSAYHYYDPTVSPTAQANKLIEVLAPYKNSIKRVWGDFEFYWSGSYQASSHWKIFAEKIIEAGYEFGVYTRKTWWDSRVGSLASWFGQFPLWAAQYNTSLTMIPLGWTKADIWQSGTPAIGTQVGTESLEVDYDVMDDQFYRNEYGGVQPPPPNGGETMKGLMENYTVNVRSPAGVAVTQLRFKDAVYGQVFTDNRERIRFSKVYRADGLIENLGQECTAVTNNATIPLVYYMTLTNEQEPGTEPPPPPPPPVGDTFIATVVVEDTSTGKRYGLENVELKELP